MAKIVIPGWGPTWDVLSVCLVCFRTSFNWDHLVTDRDGKARMLVEAEKADESLSSALATFQKADQRTMRIPSSP